MIISIRLLLDALQWVNTAGCAGRVAAGASPWACRQNRDRFPQAATLQADGGRSPGVDSSGPR
jgi:hypothetical protein